MMITTGSDTTSPAAGPLSWVLASIVAFIVILPLLVLGLAVPPQLIVPVTAVAAGLVASLVTCWVRNVFTPGSSTRLLAAVGATTVGALVVAVGMFLGMVFLPGPLILQIPPAALALGGIAAWAAWRFRSLGRHFVRDALLSLGLLAAGAVVITGALYGGCMIIACSAYSGPVE